MLTEKLWNADAIMRLFASVVICMFMGTLAAAIIGYLQELSHAKPILFFGSAAGALGLFGGALFVLRRPWSFEGIRRNFLILLGCVYGGFLLALWNAQLGGPRDELKSTVLTTLIAVISFQGAALLLIHRFLREHGMTWAEGFGFKIAWKRAIALGLLLGIAILPVTWGLQSASVKAMEDMRLQPREQTPVKALHAANTWADRVALGLVAVLIAPVAEEMLFRGILYPAIKDRGYPRLAFWGTSILFGAIHLNLAIFLPLTALALLLTWLYERTGNLLCSITTHSIFNAMNLVMMYAVPWIAERLKAGLHKPGLP